MTVCLLCLLPVLAQAEQVKVAWDPSPDPAVAGYTLLYGLRPAEYTMQIDVGNRTEFQFPELPDGTYYVVVQAYALDGLRSDFSNEVVVTFSQPPLISSTPASASERARSDFDGDGAYDIVWQHTNGTVAVWALSHHRLKSVQLLANAVRETAWQIVGTGDFNKDGKPDILWHHAAEGWLGIWLMNGTTLSAVTAPSINRLPQPQWKITAVADFNRDGNADILWRHDSGSLAVWQMKGTVVSSIVPLSPGGVTDINWTVAGAADFDSDGSPDLIWRHQSGALATWLMNGLSLKAVTPMTPGAIQPDWRVASVGDANSDGATDIIWQHKDGWIAVWYMAGTSLVQTVLSDPPGVADTNWRVVGPK